MRQPRVIRKRHSRSFPRRLPDVEIHIPRVVGILADAWEIPVEMEYRALLAQGYKTTAVEQDPMGDIILHGYTELVRP